MLAKINEARADQAACGRCAPRRNLQRSAGAFARWLISHDEFQHRPSVSVTRAYRTAARRSPCTTRSRRTSAGRSPPGWPPPLTAALVLTNTMNLVGLGHASGRAAGKPRTIWVLQVARRR